MCQRLEKRELLPDVGQASIAPGRLHQDASEVGVAGLGNAAFSNAVATGVLVWKCSAIPHQLPCTLIAQRGLWMSSFALGSVRLSEFCIDYLLSDPC